MIFLSDGNNRIWFQVFWLILGVIIDAEGFLYESAEAKIIKVINANGLWVEYFLIWLIFPFY